MENQEKERIKPAAGELAKERCDYCGGDHEIETIQNGLEILKTCPMVSPHRIVVLDKSLTKNS